MKKNQWGGARPGSGPKPNLGGPTKSKICVSVNGAVWQAALSLWRGKGSPLVETLLSAYVHNAGGGKQMEAV